MTASCLARLAMVVAVPGMLVAGWSASASANVVNTYNGAECQALSGGQAGNLIHDNGVQAKSTTVVVCPIVKNIFNSTGPLSVGPVASAGTTCQLESYDVFGGEPKRSEIVKFTGPGNTAKEIKISSSLRGAQQMVCTLSKNGIIRSYGVIEQ